VGGCGRHRRRRLPDAAATGWCGSNTRLLVFPNAGNGQLGNPGYGYLMGSKPVEAVALGDLTATACSTRWPRREESGVFSATSASG
jgi:hypothetical protein